MWIIFSLLNALFQSLSDAASKMAAQKSDEYLVSFAYRFFSLPILLPFALSVKQPVLDPPFFLMAFWVSLILPLSTILYMKAIKMAPLSLIIPILSFNPVFLLLTSYFINKELPNITGILGVVILTLGSIVLYRNRKSEKLKIDSLYSYRRPLFYMLIVALLFSFGANIDKIAVSFVHPYVWAFTVNLIGAVFLLPFILRKKTYFLLILKQYKSLFIIGVLAGLSLIFQFLAVKQTFVVYAISIKRLSILLSVIWGGLFFAERNIKIRFTAASLMVIGSVIIILS